jgi:hypothetical protein
MVFIWLYGLWNYSLLRLCGNMPIQAEWLCCRIVIIVVEWIVQLHATYTRGDVAACQVRLADAVEA